MPSTPERGGASSIDAAAMDHYVQFRKYEVDVKTRNLDSEEDTIVRKSVLHDWYGVMTGAIIKF